MKALSVLALCLLATSISHADLYVDVPADETAVARKVAPSKPSKHELALKLDKLKRQREAAASEAKKKKCNSIVINAVGEASRSRMTIFSQNEYVNAGCGDRAAFSKAYSENLTYLPSRIGKGIMKLGASAGRSVAGAAKSGLSLLNQIRPSGDASSQTDAALSKSMDSSN